MSKKISGFYLFIVARALELGKPLLEYDLKVLMLPLFLLISFVNVFEMFLDSESDIYATSCQFVKEKLWFYLLTSFIVNIKIET